VALPSRRLLRRPARRLRATKFLYSFPRLPTMELDIKQVEIEYNTRINAISRELMQREVQEVTNDYNRRINAVLSEQQEREEQEVSGDYDKRLAQLDHFLSTK
jgi:hypothetical protein